MNKLVYWNCIYVIILYGDQGIVYVSKAFNELVVMHCLMNAVYVIGIYY